MKSFRENPDSEENQRISKQNGREVFACQMQAKAVNLDLSKIVDIELGGIYKFDHPDYCDAYISYAGYPVVENPRPGFPEDWRDLTDSELDYLNNNHRDFVYEKVMDYIH